MSTKYKMVMMGLAVVFVYFAAVVNAAVDIGNKRQIFVDDYIVGSLNGTSYKMHEPVNEGMAIKLHDKPWEDRYCGYITVLKDGDVYRMYYRSIYNADHQGQGAYCYATSADGINWTKPNLGLHEYDGSRENNIMLLGPDGTHSFSPFIDTNPLSKPQERYKAIGLRRTADEKAWVLLAFVSPDGINWQLLQQEPVFTDGAFDSQNVPFWSESEHKYVVYYRTKSNGQTGIRRISRTTSDDFINWSTGVQMEYVCRGQDAPIEELYTNQTFPYFRAPDVYIATAARFMHGKRAVTDEQAASLEALSLGKPVFRDCSDAVLLSSRGGNIYQRTFMEGWIRPGMGLENWVTRTNYPALNIVQTGPNEMSTYLIEGYGLQTLRVQRYSLRLDGFVSINAPYAGGEFITKPLRFTGNKLEINYSTSAAGSVQVEIQDAAGNPIDGFSLKDCSMIIGDEISRKAAWGDKTLEPLQNTDVRLRFVMKDADIYSFKFEN